MSDWSAGYVSDIDYTYGYYSDLNPLRIKLAFLRANLIYPEIRTACELGFGQGVTVNIHAAAGEAKWYGTDFNPGQAGFARELAQSSGAAAILEDESFEQFCARDDLPDFDYIALHGIWSWISDANRKVLVEFIGRKLKIGGVLYISYNTLAAWSAFVPLRNLMAEHTRLVGQQGHAIGGRITGAVEFATELLDLNTAYARAHPLVSDRLKKLVAQPPEYVAHEYFNEDWHPMDFPKLSNWLEPAKLSFACSATYTEHISGLSLQPEQQAFLDSIPNRQLRESTRDLIVNQQFRRDYWVKGRREFSPLEQAEILREQRLILTSAVDDIEYTVKGAVGEVGLNEEIYQPIIEALSDYSVKTVGDLEAKLNPEGINLGQVFEAVIVLAGMAHIAPVQDAARTKAAKQRTKKLNQHLKLHARSRGGLNHLASPLTGGGCVVNRFEKVFLLGMDEGLKTVHELAQYAWKLFSSQGQLLTRDEKTLETEEENLDELAKYADVFLNQRLKLLKALMVV